MAKRIKFETPEERYYLGWSANSSFDKETNAHIVAWRRKTVIFHYSNGTNKCSIDGCDADVNSLTLDHVDFDTTSFMIKVGKRSGRSGSSLVNLLLDSGLPDVNIVVKCMAHNQTNRHPKNKEGKSSKYRINSKIKAYEIYNYFGSYEYMSWEHANNDGRIHRKYLSIKYNYLDYIRISGNTFNTFIRREYKAGLPNWPNLIIIHQNINHANGRGSKGKTDYSLFWTEDRYKPFRDSLTEEQKERMKNET